MSSETDLQKREDIKLAAKKLFFQFGYSKTSMEDIARASNMAKATVYYYYAGKEAIFDEVVIDETKVFLQQIRANLSAESSADQKLAQFYRHMYQGLKGYAKQMADLPAYLCEHSPHGHPIVKKLNEMIFVEYSSLINEGIDSGVFEPHAADDVANALVFMGEFMNHDWIANYPEPFRDKVIESMINILLKGLQRRSR